MNRNAAEPRYWGREHLPIAQTLIWAGPLFIHITRNR